MARRIFSQAEPRALQAARLVGLAVFAAALLIPALNLCAQSPTATAVLTSSETELGRPVQLQIKVTGASGATPPSEITVDGLDIRYSGQSQMIEGRNLHFSYSFVYNYTIMPQRAGTFKIPPLVVQAGGSALRTPELALHVVDTTGGAARAAPSTQPADAGKLAFAELIVPKKTAYVGEMIPVELRLLFNSRARARLAEGPELTGQGFTTQKMAEPAQDMQTIDGRSYHVLTYKTAIAAARTGKFEIGPVKAKALMQVPRRAGSGSGIRSPFDFFNMNDPFADPFFSDPFAGQQEQREVELKSEPATLEVKALPPNPPPGFSGAVGIFTMTTEVKPKSAQVGDPITVTTNISGRGNFDRVSAPDFESDKGWHKYPPTGKFKQDDDIGISGAKTFEQVLTPNENKHEIPPLVFAYFDPLSEKYVPLKSAATPITIEGGTATATPVPAAASTAAPTIAARPTAPPNDKQDILYQLTELPRSAQTFTPLFARPIFWMAQLLPLAALLGFLGWNVRRMRLEDRETRRVIELQNEAASLQRSLQRTDQTPDQYYADATRIVQIKTALHRRIEPASVDADAASTIFNLDESERVRLRELFHRNDEVRYSGSANGNRTVPEQTRHEITALLNRLS